MEGKRSKQKLNTLYLLLYTTHMDWEDMSAPATWCMEQIWVKQRKS